MGKSNKQMWSSTTEELKQIYKDLDDKAIPKV